MAMEMAKLLEGLQSGPVHVLGLSMGGTIAQQLALDYPERVCRLVLVSTFSVLRPESLSGWMYFLKRAFLVNLMGLQAQAKFVAHRIFPSPKDEQLREMLMASILEADPSVYRAAMLSLALFDSRRRLGHIQLPTLIVTGEEDSTVSPARQRLLADGIPGARQVIIPHAGHAVPIDQPDIFNQAVVGFLAGGK